MVSERWPVVVAVIVALLIHAAVGAVLVWQAMDTGARAAGKGGVAVGMGPAGGAPGSAEAVQPETAEASGAPPRSVEAAEVTETAEAAEPPVEEAAAEPVEPTASAAPVEADSVPEAEVAASAEPAEPETAEAASQPTTAEPTEPEQAPAESVASESPTTAETFQATEAETSEPETAESAAVGDQAEATDADKQAGSGGRSGSQQRQGAGSGDGTRGGGNPGARVDYKARIQAWLAKHKEYPRRARMRRRQGTVTVEFTFNRSGEILDYRLKEGSGHRVLDRAAERMVERADPLPEMPDDVPGETMRLTVPVAFELRR